MEETGRRCEMKVLVVYESRGGITKRVAEMLAKAIGAEGHEAVLRPLAQASPQEVEGADALLVGTWVEGYILFGVRPARAVRTWLARLPTLPGTPAGVFCTYAIHPRGTLAELRRGLETDGANVLAEHAFHRRRPEVGAEAFVRDFLERLGSLS
jgi:hypothetical protein